MSTPPSEELNIAPPSREEEEESQQRFDIDLTSGYHSFHSEGGDLGCESEASCGSSTASPGPNHTASSDEDNPEIVHSTSSPFEGHSAASEPSLTGGAAADAIATPTLELVEAWSVDEGEERARLQAEIQSSTLLAEPVNTTLEKFHRRMFVTLAIFAASGLILGLVFGIGLQPATSGPAFAPNVSSFMFNDKCVDGIRVKSLPFYYEGSTENATVVESAALTCSQHISPLHRGVWFQFHLSNSSATCINATAVGAGDFEAELALYEGGCDNLTCIVSDSSKGMNNILPPDVFWQSGLGTYHLLVAGAQGSTGTYSLEISEYSCEPNDSCEGATAVRAFPFHDSGNSVLATTEMIQCPGMVSAVRGLFYELTGTGECITASASTGSKFDAVLAAFEGDCNKLSCLGFKARENISGRITWNSKLGTSYKILVGGYGDAFGPYKLSLTENECDKCSGAIFVGNMPFTDFGNTSFASPIEAEALQSDCSSIERDDRGIWYSVEATSGYCLTASAEGSDFNFDTSLGIYEGDCGRLSCVGHNDNELECLSCKNSRITWSPPQPGLMYKVLLSGREGTTGSFSLNIMEKQCHKCRNAILVGSLPFSVSSRDDVTGPIEERILPPGCWIRKNRYYHGVWYKLHNLGTGNCISASTVGSQMDTTLAVYRPENYSAACGTLQCLNANNDVPNYPYFNPGDSTYSEVFWKGETVSLVSGRVSPKDYFILVGTLVSSGPLQRYNLTIKEYECLKNDDCTGAHLAESLPYFHSGTTIGATEESSNIYIKQCSEHDKHERGVFYEVIGTGSCIAASLRSNYNDQLVVYEGACGELTCVVQNIASMNTKGMVAWNSKNGTLYKVFVAGFEDYVGDYNLTISSCLEKDECLTATEIEALPYFDADSTENAADHYEDHLAKVCPEFGIYSYSRSGFWYRLLGTGLCISASTEGSVIDTVVGVYTGDCHDLRCVASNDDSLVKVNFVPVAGNSSHVVWRSVAGTAYRLLVAGYHGPQNIGPFRLNVTSLPCLENDDCSGAFVVSSLPYYGSGSTLAAASEGSDGLACSGIKEWYHDSLPVTSDLRNYLFDSYGVWYAVEGARGSCFQANIRSDFNLSLAIYEGDCTSLSCVSVGLTGKVAWNSTAPGTSSYKILAVGHQGERGDFTLNITHC